MQKYNAGFNYIEIKIRPFQAYPLTLPRSTLRFIDSGYILFPLARPTFYLSELPLVRMVLSRCRHNNPGGYGGNALVMSGKAYYSYETIMAMKQRTVHFDAEVCASGRSLGAIGSYAVLEEHEAIRARHEASVEEYKTPLREELESFFENLDLEPLPLPLPKALWESVRPPYSPHGFGGEIEPFNTACLEGDLDTVKYWAREKRGDLRQVGLQHGLALASSKNQTDIVRYLLDEGGAYLDGAVIELACLNLCLPMFELAVEHGYHPNQQIPSPNGFRGTAIKHCLASFEITQFLLVNGADPDLGPWQDTRCQGWGARATPPMDRQSGIVLDKAVEKGYIEVTELLLRSGAHIGYSRPIHVLIDRNAQDWRPFMDLLCRYGVNVNANKAHPGSPYRALHFAVHMGMWDLAEYLIEHGADPYAVSRPKRRDAFKEAAIRVERDRKYSLNEQSPSDDVPVGTVNPLLEIVERVERRRGDKQGPEKTTTEA